MSEPVSQTAPKLICEICGAPDARPLFAAENSPLICEACLSAAFTDKGCGGDEADG